MNNRETFFPETIPPVASLPEEVEGIFDASLVYRFEVGDVYQRALQTFQERIAEKSPTQTLPFQDEKTQSLETTLTWNNLQGEGKKLLATGSWEALISILPESIVFSQLEPEPLLIMEALVNQGYGKLVLGKIQKIEYLSALNYRSSFFNTCLEKGLVKEVKALLPEVKPTDYFDQNVIHLFVSLSRVDKEYGAELIEKFLSFLPEEVNMENLNSWEVKNLELLLFIDPDFEKHVLSRVTGSIDILLIGPEQLSLIDEMCKKGYGEKLIDLIQPSQKKINLGVSTSYLMTSLIEQGYGEKVLSVVKTIPDKNSRTAFFVYKSLIDHGYAEEVLRLKVLPDSLEIDSNSEYFLQFLGLLGSFIEVGHGAEVARCLVVRDISDVNTSSENILVALVKAGFGNEVKTLVNLETHFQYLRQHARRLLIALSVVDEVVREKMVAELPLTVELKQISRDINYFGNWFNGVSPDDNFRDWIEGGFADEIAKRFKGSPNFLLDFFYKYGQDTSQKEFLLSLARNGQKERLQELFGEQLKEAEKVIRRPIEPEYLKLPDKVGPHLDEIIQKFPLDPESPVEELRSGWYKIKLKKTGSATYAYLQLTAHEFKVVFKNEGISEERLENYRLAHELIPGYVSSANYPELQSEEVQKEHSTLKSFTYGFREVYAGPDVSFLKMNILPFEVSRSIEWQKKYILLQLSINGIDHGHPHNDNFNVRFLLEKDGEKQLFFDPNVAIKTAIEQQMTLTPIVTLRDWDQATS